LDNDQVFRNLKHKQILKSTNKEFFQIFNLVLEEDFARKTTNTGWCASGGLGPSVATRAKTRKEAGIGIHRDIFWKVTRTGLHSIQSKHTLS
jgi:hypothetical protein